MIWLQQFGLWLARWAGWSPDPGEDWQRAHLTLVQLHGDTVAERDQLRQERDSAIAAFQAYAEKNLAIRADLRVRAETLVTQYQRKQAHHSGEYRRHQVYAELIKEFPKTPHRDLSLAIEMAVRARV